MSRVRPDAVVMARVIQALQLGNLSCADVAAISGLHLKTATKHMSDLYHHEPKFVHVGDWAFDARGFATVRLYRWGNLPDAPKPIPPTSSTNRVRRLRANRKAAAA